MINSSLNNVISMNNKRELKPYKPHREDLKKNYLKKYTKQIIFRKIIYNLRYI